MIKIYGSPRTSAGRCFLLLEELGLPYETINLDMREREHKGESYLKLNPNGKVPCLIDGGFVLWESMAINFYLAEKYKPELLGKTSEEKGLTMQWSTWGMLELQPPMVDILIQTFFVPEAKRDHKLIETAKEKIPPLLKILDQALIGKTYIAGSQITVGDFNLASVVNIAGSIQIPLTGYPHLLTWLERIRTRPSFQKLIQMRSH